MSEHTVEKNFLYLILFSALLHVGLFTLLLNMPAERKPATQEPLMVDLQDIPQGTSPRVPSAPAPRLSDEYRRVPAESAPKGDSPWSRMLPPLPSASAPRPPAPGNVRPVEPAPRESSPAGELFRKKGAQSPEKAPRLYPSAERLARIEEGYRKKYAPDVAEGDASFLNTDDIVFGSFLRRFETAVYGVWRYPQEAVKMGIEGVTPVRIVFNRKGEVVSRELLQSSGSKILDNEVLRTLDMVGPVGAFPKGYAKDTFTLIAFFHYGISQGASRSLH